MKKTFFGILFLVSTMAVAKNPPSFHLFLDTDCPACYRYHQQYHASVMSLVKNNHIDFHINLISKKNAFGDLFYYLSPAFLKEWALERMFYYSDKNIHFKNMDEVFLTIEDDYHFSSDFKKEWREVKKEMLSSYVIAYPQMKKVEKNLHSFRVKKTPTLFRVTEDGFFPEYEAKNFYKFIQHSIKKSQ